MQPREGVRNDEKQEACHRRWPGVVEPANNFFNTETMIRDQDISDSTCLLGAFAFNLQNLARRTQVSILEDVLQLNLVAPSNILNPQTWQVIVQGNLLVLALDAHFLDSDDFSHLVVAM